MKKAMIAAAIVGIAAAGVILYLTKKETVKGILDEVSGGAKDAGRLATRHLRKTQEKINNILHENLS
ncbi:hypothetical protein SAMN05428988_0200 [Chitinophaga sp. YR573]|uniref:hypothetical protein n=1 Tax=Chitinophaga sp. YR573 TaxID=1881040 RepID=UPI0008CF994F|nr:hypothetical protein [Chitinophaga sp. YR573]SEV89335.1 hypothetical protein SAMN05428988_0200 [Chitinophaga sp. YR573]